MNNLQVENEEIDENLYSRQLYTLGKEAMKKLRNKKILISGLNGLGLEVAKNIILSGVYQVSLHDDQNASSYDFSSLFYGCSLENIGKNRAEIVYERLCELNEYVKVILFSQELNQSNIAEFDVIVLCDMKSTQRTIEINNWCHDSNKIFINTAARGVFGMIFCDFGNEFSVLDPHGTEPEPLEISSIIKDKKGKVIVAGDKGHGMCDESFVKFFDVKGMTELNELEPFQIEVENHMTVNIGDISTYGEYVEHTGYIKEVFIPKKFNFNLYSDFVKRVPSFNEICIADWSKVDAIATIHLCFLTLNKFIEQNKKMPESWNSSDAEQFVVLFKAIAADFEKVKIKEELVRIFSYVCRGNLNPLHAALGGIVGQEVLKACSQQFFPITQFYYTDFVECLPEDWELQVNNVKLFEPRDCRYDGQVAVFGSNFQQKLASQNLFVIGAGAIGCEILKNLAMIGVCSGKKDGCGKLFVTDMDFIERSNLNRQFLFRNWNIGQSKSFTAATAVRIMNPELNIEAHENRLCKETENVYNNAFFSSLNCVLNALDNVDARVYAASRIEFNNLPLIDSGTMGPQASQQVILPHISKTYKALQNQENAIPICTIKNFPYQIEHTIQWAKDLFSTYFTTIPKQAQLFLENKEEFFKHVDNLTIYQKFETVSQMVNFFKNIPNNSNDCIMWALKEWDDYSKSIQQILYSYPPDHITQEGLPFWSGNKRVPTFQPFDYKKDVDINFIVFGSKLRARLFQLPIPINKDIKEVASTYKFEKFIPTTEKIATDDSELEKFLDRSLLEKRITELKNMDTKLSIKLDPQEFEKDDDSNFHIDFITAASNMRAVNYSIIPADRFKTKKIAGRIIPAIATSTSVISGQVCLELIKIIQGHKTNKKFRDSYLNLSSPVFTMTIPEKPQVFDVLGKQYTVWDKLDVQGDITLKEFRDVMKNKFGYDLTCLTYQNGVLYTSWFDEDYLEDNLSRRITDIIKNKLNIIIHDGEKIIPLHFGIEDENGEEIEQLPIIRYSF